MKKLIANTLNETEKVFSARKTYLFLGISAFVPVVSAFLLDNVRNSIGITIGGSSQFVLLMLNLFTFLFLPLFAGMAAIDLFTGEVKAGTLKMVLIRPIARWKVYVSKIAALGGYTALHLGVIWLVSVLSTLLIIGEPIFQGMFTGLMAYAVSFLPMMTLGLMTVFVAQLFRNSTGALVFCMVLYILAKFLPFFFPKFASLSPVSFTDWYMLWIGSAASAGKLFTGMLFLVSTAILFFTLGLTMFDKKEL